MMRLGSRFSKGLVSLAVCWSTLGCSFSTQTGGAKSGADAKTEQAGDKPVKAPEWSTGQGSETQSQDQAVDDVPSSTTTKAAAANTPKKPSRKPRPEMNKKAQSAYDAGKQAFAAGDLDGAKTQFKAAIKSDKNAYLAHYSLGVTYERLGNEGSAARSYQSALSVVSDHQASAVAYSLLLARQQNFDSALSVLKKAEASLGPDPALLTGKAEVRSMQGQSGDAQQLAQQALKLDPSYKPAMVALARDHYRARRIDLALYALTGILDGYGEGNPPRDKKNAEAHLLRGIIYAERGLRGPAMEEMEKALALRPDLVDAHLVLANFMMEAGNAKEARIHLEQAVRYDNKNITAHLQLGDAYRLLGKTDRAKRELEWVLKADPNQAAAHYNLGLLFLLSGKVKGMTEMQTIDQAIFHLEEYKARAQRGGPDDVDDLITRAKTNKALLKAKAEEG